MVQIADGGLLRQRRWNFQSEIRNRYVRFPGWYRNCALLITRPGFTPPRPRGVEARTRASEEARRRGGEQASRQGGEQARRRGGEEARRRASEQASVQRCKGAHSHTRSHAPTPPLTGGVGLRIESRKSEN